MTQPRLYLGAISGTSVDGIDLALVDISKETKILAGETVAFESSIATTLKELVQGVNGDLDTLGHCDAVLGELIGSAVKRFLENHQIDVKQVIALGCHGQTVRHRPAAAVPFTLQIGDPNRIAEITGVTTVADFRRRDVAAGGQGAPLVPAFHRVLFSSTLENRTVANIGGIANITNLPLQSPSSMLLSGFDTGPGNALLDSWMMQHRGQPFDRNGAWAATGTSQSSLLETWLSDPYFSAPPPKSTGREYFNLHWLRSFENLEQFRTQDIQATLVALTTRSLADALQRWGCSDGPLIVCGGGRLNAQLMANLGACLPTHTIRPSEYYGQNGDLIEAATFAWLAYCRLEGKAANEPTVTGARGNRILGSIYPA